MDSNFFLSRVFDVAESCEKNCIPKFLGFLTSEEASIAADALKKRNIRYSFFGGYDEAERVFLACLPEWCDDAVFPITPITFSFRKEDELSHRDFLGSLMALGLTREKIGDILVEKGRAVAFVSENIAEHIISQIDKVGRVGVSLNKGCVSPLPSLSTLADFTITATSARLDCIISAICGYSRNKATEIIEAGLVSVNSIMSNKITKTVVDNDKIAVRGKGKFIICSTDERSKKGKIILKYKKYV